MFSADILLAILVGSSALLSGILALSNCIIDVKEGIALWRGGGDQIGLSLTLEFTWHSISLKHQIGLMGTIGYDYYNIIGVYECIS